MITVEFTQPKDVVVVAEKKRTISKITISQITDTYNQKKVVAVTQEVGMITLWEGDAYDAIGQWTDSDVQARLQELYA